MKVGLILEFKSTTIDYIGLDGAKHTHHTFPHRVAETEAEYRQMSQTPNDSPDHRQAQISDMDRKTEAAAALAASRHRID